MKKRRIAAEVGTSVLAPEPDPPHSLAWLPALCVAQVGTVLVFMNFAGALPLIQAEWGLSHGQAGAFQAARQLGYVLAVLILSSLTDYVRAERLIVGSALWAALGNLAFAFLADGATSGMILRTLTGMGVAGIYMPGVKVISQRVRPERRGRAVGLFVSSFTLGAAASIGLGGGLAAALGWRTALALTSLGPLAGAAIVWLAVPPQVRPHPALDRLTPRSPIDQTASHSLTGVLHNRPALLAIAAYAAHAWETLGLRGWLPAFLAAVLTASGVSLSQATRTGATVTGIATVIGAIGVVLMGAVSDRLGRTRTIMVVSGSSSACILALGLILEAPWALIVAASLLAAFLVNADGGVISATLTESVPEEILGRVLGVYSFLGFTAGAIAPLVFGAVLDFVSASAAGGSSASRPAWFWAFATLSVSSLAVLATAVALHRETKPRPCEGV